MVRCLVCKAMDKKPQQNHMSIEQYIVCVGIGKDITFQLNKT